MGAPCSDAGPAGRANPSVGASGNVGAVSRDDRSDAIRWLSTAEAANHLGITPRTLYRFIDEGQVPAYRFGRVIRLKADEVEAFIETCRIEPGTLEHLYPVAVSDGSGSAAG